MTLFDKASLNNKIISFAPLDLVRDCKIIFEVKDLGLSISSENWPSNLIFDPSLYNSNDMFYEKFCSDTTLSFYITSAIGRCKSLISRATHEPKTTWEHGLINIFKIEGNCPESYMTRTITSLALRLK